jgi:hypothetical protein
MAVCVGDQHVERLAQHLLGGTRERLRRVHDRPQRPPIGGEAPAPARLRSVGERGEVRHRRRPRGIARDGEQRVDRRLQAVHLGQRGDELRPRLTGQLHRLQLEAQAGERRAELVRGVRAERALACDQVVEAARAAVQRSGDRVRLRDPGARGAGGEVAVAEPARGVREPLERPGERAPEHHGGEHGEPHENGRERREPQPRAAHVARGGGVAALRAQCAAHPLALQQRHGDDEPVAVRVRREPAAAHGRPHGRVGARGPAAGVPAPREVVDREPVGGARQLDGIGARAEVRRPRGGDRVALEAQELLPAVLRANDERERHGEEDDRHGRHGGDGEDEPAPHGRSKR